MGDEKAMQDTGVQDETGKIVVTLRVMNVFSVLPGAPKACMNFRDPTVFGLIITGLSR